MICSFNLKHKQIKQLSPVVNLNYLAQKLFCSRTEKHESYSTTTKKEFGNFNEVHYYYKVYYYSFVGNDLFI